MYVFNKEQQRVKGLEWLPGRIFFQYMLSVVVPAPGWLHLDVGQTLQTQYVYN